MPELLYEFIKEWPNKFNLVPAAKKHDFISTVIMLPIQYKL